MPHFHLLVFQKLKVYLTEYLYADVVHWTHLTFSLMIDTRLVFSACVAAIKCHPVLHHCAVIFSQSAGITSCMFLTFKNRVLLMCKEASVLLHFTLPLINNLNKTQAAIFHMQVILSKDFPLSRKKIKSDVRTSPTSDTCEKQSGSCTVNRPVLGTPSVNQGN